MDITHHEHNNLFITNTLSYNIKHDNPLFFSYKLSPSSHHATKWHKQELTTIFLNTSYTQKESLGTMVSKKRYHEKKRWRKK